LVQCGVPLNTMRDRLGFSSIAMTLRDGISRRRREAVAKLNDRPHAACTAGI
jgi:hypothetical protein